ncbi:MAG: AhpC/TSA family protein [Muribaculaceae bacterium]|nr:AhpC/TSA family protein [Muribaculaceae bacterium]
MIKKILYASAALLMAACSQTAKEPATEYNVAVDYDEEGVYVFLNDYDTGEKIDSAVVVEGVASFKGDIAKPALVRIIINGKRNGSFILEADSIHVYNIDSIVGGELNARMDRMSAEVAAVYEEYLQLNDSLQDAMSDVYTARLDSIETATMNENITNPIGFYLFLNKAYEMSLEDFEAAITKTPELGEYKRIQDLKEAKLKKAETSEGKMFKDFEIPGENGEVFHLSDVVGKGQYVLVDFWASWCKPCIAETEVIKEIYKEYAPKGLKVLGVAVWDEPEDTRNAIETHQLPWQNVLNAQRIPTDIYGISGIPCIILFGPDGTIVARDKYDDDLRKAVAEAFNK